MQFIKVKKITNVISVERHFPKQDIWRGILIWYIMLKHNCVSIWTKLNAESWSISKYVEHEKPLKRTVKLFCSTYIIQLPNLSQIMVTIIIKWFEFTLKVNHIYLRVTTVGNCELKILADDQAQNKGTNYSVWGNRGS